MASALWTPDQCADNRAGTHGAPVTRNNAACSPTGPSSLIQAPRSATLEYPEPLAQDPTPFLALTPVAPLVPGLTAPQHRRSVRRYRGLPSPLLRTPRPRPAAILVPPANDPLSPGSLHQEAAPALTNPRSWCFSRPWSQAPRGVPRSNPVRGITPSRHPGAATHMCSTR